MTKKDVANKLQAFFQANADKTFGLAYISVRSEDAKVSNDKVKIARKQYRGQGKYIEDILL